MDVVTISVVPPVTKTESPSPATGDIDLLFRAISESDLMADNVKRKADGSSPSTDDKRTKTTEENCHDEYYSTEDGKALMVRLWDDLRTFCELKRPGINKLLKALRELSKLRTGKTVSLRDHAFERTALVSIWTMASDEEIDIIAHRFNLPSSQVMDDYTQFIYDVYDISYKFIAWPESVKDLNAAVKGWVDACDVKDVLGTVGAVRVPYKIVGPLNVEISYDSMMVQCVSDSNHLFVDVSAGWKGATSKSTIFELSPIHERMTSLSPTKKKLGMACSILTRPKYFLLADGAVYPPRRYFKNFPKQLVVNELGVDYAFASVNRKFKRLALLERAESSDGVFLVKTVVAACVLHNISLSVD